MATRLVTEESVHAAAEELRAAAINVTCDAVRERLGGGSNRDIVPHLQTWRRKLAAQVAAVFPADDSPSDLAKYVREVVAKAERFAARRAADEVRTLRDELDARNAQVLAERDGLRNDISDLISEFDKRSQDCASLEVELDKQGQLAQDLSRQLADARTQHAAAVAGNKEAQARISDLKDAQTGLLRELSVERDATDRLRQRERELENELKEVCAGSARKEVDAARTLGQAEATIQQLKQAVDELEARVLGARQELHDSHVALVEKTEEAAKVAGEAKASERHWEEVKVALDRRLSRAVKTKAVVTELNANVSP